MIEVVHADMLEALPEMAARGVLVDSVVTDPPYHLTSIVKRFGGTDAAPAKVGKTGAYARASKGFMGQQWDGGDVAFRPETWASVMAVMKPGAHLFAFSATRTYHRMACAIEDAGFEIRDQFVWVYGKGFPKSHNIGKAIAKHIGGDTPEAVQWDGWGTAAKPAWEPIVLARKPLSEKSIAANVLRHGTGALNIGGCRVPWADEADEAAACAAASFANSRAAGNIKQSTCLGKESRDGTNRYDPGALSGRWPANIVHDGSPDVVSAFTAYGPGDPSRFFYSAKADDGDRCGSKHPTVKPTDLMAWLLRIVTPPGGTVLDPFAGSGSTGMAAMREGFNAILIEREAEYVADIRRRIEHVSGGGTPLLGGDAPPPRDEGAQDLRGVRRRIGPTGMKL